MSTCTGPECDRPVRAAGLCASHYQQRRRGQKLRPLSRQSEADVAMTLRMSDELHRATLEAAEREGLPAAEWWRRAAQERLRRTRRKS